LYELGEKHGRGKGDKGLRGSKGEKGEANIAVRVVDWAPFANSGRALLKGETDGALETARSCKEVTRIKP